MIRIIKGTAGYWDGEKVVPYTAADENISLTPEAEAHFVSRGIAEYVGEYVPPVDYGHEITVPYYHVDMKAEELRNIGKEHGLTFKVGTSKATMVAALDEHFGIDPVPEDADGDHFADTDEMVDDGEAAPTFDSTEAVR